MKKNVKPKTIHKQRFETIAKYVDFKMSKNPSAYEKQKIKKYFDEIKSLTARPFQVYRPRSQEKLDIAQGFSQHSKKLKGLKVAFVPSDGSNKMRITINKKGIMSTRTKHVKTDFITLDKYELIKNPVDHTNERIAENKTAKNFSIACGEYEMQQSFTRETMAVEVLRLAEKYDKVEENHYFGNWLFGLKAHTFSEQSDFDEYDATKTKAKKDLQETRKKAKAKLRRNKVDGRTTRHKRK